MKTHACASMNATKQIPCTFIISDIILIRPGSKQTNSQTAVVHQIKLVIYKGTCHFTQKESNRSWC